MNNKTERLEHQFEDHSFEIETEDHLLSFFSDKDQKRILAPSGVSYPLHVPHYFAWREPSGVYVYMVFKKPQWKSPVGIVLKRSYAGATLTNSRLCDWCLSYGSSDQVGFLSVNLNSRESIAMMLCLDLGCMDRLQEAAELSGKNFEKLAQQLYERIGRFYEGILREKRIPDPGNPDADKIH